MSKQFTVDQLKDLLFVRQTILQFIEQASVDELDYEGDEECCEYCEEDEDECSDCDCHSYPGYDQYLCTMITSFIRNNFIPKEESK